MGCPPITLCSSSVLKFEKPHPQHLPASYSSFIQRTHRVQCNTNENTVLQREGELKARKKRRRLCERKKEIRESLSTYSGTKVTHRELCKKGGGELQKKRAKSKENKISDIA